MFIYLQMIEAPEERSKFEKLYLRYRDTMYAVAYRILQNPQEAEDAVHHAFLKIIENISKIQEIDCPKTKGYVVTIVENRAIDIYRRKKAHDALIGRYFRSAANRADLTVKCMIMLAGTDPGAESEVLNTGLRQFTQQIPCNIK